MQMSNLIDVQGVSVSDWVTGVRGWRQSSAGWFRVEFPGRYVTELLRWRHGVPSRDVRVCWRGTDASVVQNHTGVTNVSLVAQQLSQPAAPGTHTCIVFQEEHLLLSATPTACLA